MNNNIDFNELWHQQKAETPDTTELAAKMKAFKYNGLGRLLFTNVVFLLTSAFIISIWYYYQPAMVTTKIGIVLVILAMALFVLVYNQSIALLTKIDYEQDISNSLKTLLRLKEKQQVMQGTLLNIYFILLSIGISLYMIEYTLKMTWAWAIFTYGITLAWIAFNWLYIRPRHIKKQQAKTELLISKLELLNAALKEN